MDQSKRYILDYDNFVQTLARGTFTSKKVIPEKQAYFHIFLQFTKHYLQKCLKIVWWSEPGLFLQFTKRELFTTSYE